jgi:hypothetical protein
MWANIRERIVVSNSPSAFGLPGLVSIRISSGWPFRHRWTSFLVARDKAEDFVNRWPNIDGAKQPALDAVPAALNAVTALTAIVLSMLACEFGVRRVSRKE